MFDRLAALPADAWNWDDRRAGPTLCRGQGHGARRRDRRPQPVDHAEGRLRPPDARAEAQDAIAQCEGAGLIVGAGCVLPTGHSDATLVELVKSLGGEVKLAGIPPA